MHKQPNPVHLTTTNNPWEHLWGGHTNAHFKVSVRNFHACSHYIQTGNYLPAYHLHQPYAISLHYQSKSLITTVLQLTTTRVTTPWLNNHFVFVVILQLWCAFIMTHLQKFCGCQCILVVRWTGQVHLGLPYAISLQYQTVTVSSSAPKGIVGCCYVQYE